MKRTTKTTRLPVHGRQPRADGSHPAMATHPASRLSRLRTGAISLALVAACILLPASPATAAPPANDDFSNAIELVGPAGTVSGDTSEATQEAEETCTQNCGGSVWYRWTPAVTGTSSDTFDLCQFPGYNTYLTVHRGSSLADLTLVAEDDTSCAEVGLSTVTFEATYGINYYIRVGGYLGSAGTYTLAFPAGGAIVEDTTGPVLNVPANLTVRATSSSGVSVSYTVTATDAVDGSTPVTCTPPSGTTFTVGTTLVTCSSTDSSGNTTTATFTVQVTAGKADKTGPAIKVPATVHAQATSPAGATVSYTVTANDAVDGPTSVTCTPPSGSTFGIGTTKVGCSSTDSSGNTSSKLFNVQVKATKASR